MDTERGGRVGPGVERPVELIFFAFPYSFRVSFYLYVDMLTIPILLVPLLSEGQGTSSSRRAIITISAQNVIWLENNTLLTQLSSLYVLA